MNSIGILTGGGIGRVVAHWIASGKPDVDVTGHQHRPLAPVPGKPRLPRAPAPWKSLGMVYQCHYPTRSMRTARGVKRSPLHDRLASQGAFFRDVSGWEGADWYAGEGKVADLEELSWGRQGWWDHWEAEHHAARQGVILMDMSFMSKFSVEGRDAASLLSRLSANDVDGEPGTITYTQWLNDAGRIEADLTVTKLADDRFFVVASDTAYGHALSWLRRHVDPSMHVFVADVTSAYAQINIQGPRSRELMSKVTSIDMSNEAFGFRRAAEIDLGYARALCIRITYLGELGYELYIPAEQALHVYERLLEAGGSVGLRHAGLKALASLRMEKGYRDYGHDIDNTDSVLEAGLGFAVALEKAGGFIGRDAVLARKQAGPLCRRLVQVLVKDPSRVMSHAEVVLRDGVPVGYVRAASYGFTLGGAVGLAMLDAGDEPLDKSWIEGGDFEVDIAGVRSPAVVSLQPLYDPSMSRIKA